ncbi:MAG: hypothetical protein ISS16_01765 [Ignavibacteria bacterium]|nr:hypothetical protein [Ignavibacteria bacterium]
MIGITRKGLCRAREVNSGNDSTTNATKKETLQLLHSKSNPNKIANPKIEPMPDSTSGQIDPLVIRHLAVPGLVVLVIISAYLDDHLKCNEQKLLF